MELDVVKGLGPKRQEKLGSAGIRTVADLAACDPAEVAGQTDIGQGVLENLREQAVGLDTLSGLEGIEDDELDRLIDAGVRSLDELEAADADELSSATDVDAKRIQAWQGAPDPEEGGLEETARDVAAGAREAGQMAFQGLEEARVVLEEGISDAKVKFEDDVLAEVRILPIKAKDDVDNALEGLRGDVVVLREKADTALVRVEDEIVEGLPIFKEKVSEAGRSAADSVDEVRVKVEEIRDKRVLPEAEKITDKIKGLFDRS